MSCPLATWLRSTKWDLTAEQEQCLVLQQEALANGHAIPKPASMQGSTKPLHAWQSRGLCPASAHPRSSLPGVRSVYFSR